MFRGVPGIRQRTMRPSIGASHTFTVSAAYHRSPGSAWATELCRVRTWGSGSQRSRSKSTPTHSHDRIVWLQFRKTGQRMIRTRSIDSKEAPMPPRGVKKGTKRARQYEHVKKSERQQGRPEKRAKEIAARTVQKERARSGESRTRSRTSTRDISSGRRGGQRSGTSRSKGRTRDQLYNEAKKLNIQGRSRMSKSQL